MSGRSAVVLSAYGTGIGHDSLSDAELVASAGDAINALGETKSNNEVDNIPVEFDVTSGQLFDLNFNISAISVANAGSSDASGDTPGDATIDGDFAHTIAWGGILSVTDDNGNPLTDWSLTSSSGYDYTQAFIDTPEPTSFAALALSAVFLARRHER